MSTFGDLSKYKQNTSAYIVPSYVPKQKYSLTDLREDEEFNKVTERFLTSLGEGEDVGDLFGYFRGADYNLGDATKMAFESGKFNSQQKTDYQSESRCFVHFQHCFKYLCTVLHKSLRWCLV